MWMGCRMRDGSKTDTWFSPLGARNHAAAHMAPTMNRPIKMLHLEAHARRANVSFPSRFPYMVAWLFALHGALWCLGDRTGTRQDEAGGCRGVGGSCSLPVCHCERLGGFCALGGGGGEMVVRKRSVGDGRCEGWRWFWPCSSDELPMRRESFHGYGAESQGAGLEWGLVSTTWKYTCILRSSTEARFISKL